ncbi:Fc receptor-like A isoform X8 [Talpa occidentalis]|uniref:Fc receptor-like A isoform X8 n=1 Tax=Talpa occidentalis TaxID=50954 RepID=UPI00188FD54E|nr:Fc receptor-like A isoform X8 [Talpa occidentalis]
MKLGCVLTASAFHFFLLMLWAAHIFLAACFETLQREGPAGAQDSGCHIEDDLTDPRDVDFHFRGYTFSEPFHLIVSYGPSKSAAPSSLNPASQESAAPKATPPEPPNSLPPPSVPSSEDPSFSSPLQVPDPHLYHQMGVLLKEMQDVRVLLGYLVKELRTLSHRLKLESPESPAKEM